MTRKKHQQIQTERITKIYDSSQLALQVKITLDGIDPPIWRQIVLPKDMNFAQLHEVIQAAFGWNDSHLHQFVVGGLIVGAPEFNDEGLNERQTFEATSVFLRDLDLYSMPNLKLLYLYDFGDCWRHWIEFEEVVPKKADEKYPKIIDGARHCPPEDAGGASGYEEFLEAWGDAEHYDHKRMKQWAGKKFSPEAFDIEKTQKAIDLALKRCQTGYRFRLLAD